MEKQEIENILNLKYNMHVSYIEKSEESTDGNVYIIFNTDKTKYVIKVYDNLKHAESMVSLHTYLNEIGLKAPEIIENNLGEKIVIHEDKYIVCYSFVEGVKLKRADFTDKRIENVALYLRKLHSINNNILNLKSVPYKVNLDRQSILHFDITKNNIFVNQDGNENDEICFIDFDDAKFGSSVCDVAIATTNLFMSKADGLNKEGMMNFIDSYYQEDNMLKKKELPYIKDAAIKWLKSIIDNPNFDTSTRVGLENKLSIWNQLDI